jgi:hypothetical protein
MRFAAILALGVILSGWPTIGLAGSSASETPVKATVELFTSQGCSSCPPADALFEHYAARTDIVALSFPVDYWDYLGWKDTLASAKFTERQRAYAKGKGKQVYTPEVVVSGIVSVIGSRKSDIDKAIENAAAALAPIRPPVRLRLEEDKLTIEVGEAPAGELVKEATLWLALVAKSITVTIRRGENEGKTVTYFNVVRELTPVGMWSGKPLTVHLERDAVLRPGIDACAVLVQQGMAGPIVGAASLGSF